MRALCFFGVLALALGACAPARPAALSSAAPALASALPAARPGAAPLPGAADDAALIEAMFGMARALSKGTDTLACSSAAGVSRTRRPDFTSSGTPTSRSSCDSCCETEEDE